MARMGRTRLASRSSDSDSGLASEEEADEAVRHLHRLNSIQRGYFGRPKDDKSICCWDQGHVALPKHHTSRRGVANQVTLSVYADSIGDNLAELHEFLDEHVGDGAIGSLHVLPLYPSTGDRGFAPVTYQEVDPRFGTWGMVKDLASEYQLCLEYMVNHISPSSPQFQDYIQHGEASRFSDMFVKWRDIWPEGKPSAEQLARIRTRKPAPPVIEVTLADGSKVPLWNTFSDQQIDINPFSEEGWKFTEASLVSLCTNGGAKLIRLDAFGYVTKKAGTSCFMEEPEVWDLLDRIRQVVKPFGVQLLCEVHEDFHLNIELARHGFWVYDFALPLLILHALRFKTAESLKHWLSICPRRQITTLDTHDGMGIDDVAGLAPIVDVREVEQCVLGLGGTVNYKHYYEPEMHATDSDDSDGVSCAQCSVSSRKSLEAVQQYLQPDCMKGCYTSVQHQLNATYFSATQEDPQMYLLARAVQFFTPGVPMVYYNGLLAGRNDYELLEKGGIRDINRHSYSLEEARSTVKRPVVQALLKLCRFRNHHPAFKGRVFIDDNTPPDLLRVCWYNGTKHLAVLRANFESQTFSISHTPYKTPSATDEAVEQADMQSQYSWDLTQVFSLDALDMMDRAQRRMKVAEGLGVTDPEQLLAVRDIPPLAAPRSQYSSDGIAGSSQNNSVASTGRSSSSSSSSSSRGGGAAGNGSSFGSASDSQLQVQCLSSAVGSSSDTDAEAGSEGAADGRVAGVQRFVSRGRSSAAKEGVPGVGSTHNTAAGEVVHQERGLLQLQLDFAWRLPDTPCEDVDRLLQGAAVSSR